VGEGEREEGGGEGLACEREYSKRRIKGGNKR